MSLKLKIVSPEKIEYLGLADRVLVPGTSGKFEILTNHAPIISSLEEGDVEFSYEDDVKNCTSMVDLLRYRRMRSVCVLRFNKNVRKPPYDDG